MQILQKLLFKVSNYSVVFKITINSFGYRDWFF
jgi:hypothetical protein